MTNKIAMPTTKLFIIRALKTIDGIEKESYVWKWTFDGGLSLADLISSAKLFTQSEANNILGAEQRGSKYAAKDAPLLEVYEVSFNKVEPE